MLKSKKIIVCLILILIMSVVLLAGCAQNAEQKQTEELPAEEVKGYPEKPIQLAVWTSPGADVDLVSRAIAPVLETYLGQPIVCTNIEGGSGMVAISQMINDHEADGYFLINATTSLSTGMASGQLTFNVEDFDFVGQICYAPFVLAVRTDSKYQSLEEIIEAAKENPGKLTVAHGLVGGAHHVAVSSLWKQAGVDITSIPFEGQGDAVMAVLGGHADILHGNPGPIMPQVNEGNLKVIAVSSSVRLNDFPDAPTYNEIGYNPPFDGHWRGIIAKKGLPQDVLDTLQETLAKAVDDPQFVEYLENSGTLSGYLNSKDFEAKVSAQIETTKEILRDIGMLK